MEVRLILGDQLNPDHSWFTKVDKNICYVMYEMRQETDYVRHHIQKVVAFFGAMRQFAKHLESKGHMVLYFTIDDPENEHQLDKNLEKTIKMLNARSFSYLYPDEYRLDEQLKTFCKKISLPSKAIDSEHFMTSRDELAHFFKGKKSMIMEFFYRHMRKKHQILMNGDQPEGGAWNFDKHNRNKWKGTPEIPLPYQPKTTETQRLKKLIDQSGIQTMGVFDEKNFLFPLNHQEAQAQLNYFCEHLLEYFGTYQDAMHTKEVNLFHARISFGLNVKLLHPLDVIQQVVAAYRKDKEKISLAQVEGFVRQVLGWREYMRGLYWKEMPKYKSMNALDNHNTLPDFYWTGKTKMNCLSTSIKNSLDNAYAHHIQRLMITGNFALLSQSDPDEVDRWYLGVYADAIEWVQLPNTRGMSQYADGGIVATKPYVSSGSYINKMSDYCQSCMYNQKKRIGDDACPFNSLYWNFLDDKRELLQSNNRMGMMLNLLKKIPTPELIAIKERAYQILENPDAF